MQIILNGSPYEVEQSENISDLLRELKLEGKLAVEINKKIIPRTRYKDFTIKQGDQVEIVHAIGGGCRS